MNYVITLIISFLIISAVIIILSRVRTPRYRLQRENIVTLLKMVLNGTASENDWNVFVSISIPYDPELESIRVRCIEIEKREFRGNSIAKNKNRYLFTKTGLRELEEILLELQINHIE